VVHVQVLEAYWRGGYQGMDPLMLNLGSTCRGGW